MDGPELIARAGRFHPWDAMAPAALSAILQRGPFQSSVETGCGGSTIVLSHASDHHIAFAIEGEDRTITELCKLSLAPSGDAHSRALELGSYLQMSAALERVLGYGSVVGAYHSRKPHQEWKSVRIAGQQDFTCRLDLFDVEAHTFPYTDGAFDLVLCCEIIEHLVRDPMHMLFGNRSAPLRLEE